MKVEAHDPVEVAALPAFLVLIPLLVLHYVVGGSLQALDIPFGLAFDELFILALPVLILVRAQNYRPAPFLGLRAPGPSLVAASLLVGAVSFLFAGGVNSLNNLLVGEEIARLFDPSRLFQIEEPARKVLLVVSVAVLAPLGEELLFRGYLLRVLRARHGVRPALVITSAIFAVIHVNPASVLALFALGMVFGLLRVISGSLWPAMIAHALQNGTSSAIVLLGFAEQSPDELSLWSALLLLAVSTPLLVIALRAVRSAAAPEPDAVPVDPAQGHELRLSRAPGAFLAWLACAAAALAVFAAAGGMGRSPQDAPDAQHR